MNARPFWAPSPSDDRQSRWGSFFSFLKALRVKRDIDAEKNLAPYRLGQSEAQEASKDKDRLQHGSYDNTYGEGENTIRRQNL